MLVHEKDVLYMCDINRQSKMLPVSEESSRSLY